MIKINWSQFKDLLDKQQIRARYVITDVGYAIHGADQGLIYTCDVLTGEADCTEFEDDYLAAIDAAKVASVQTEFGRSDIVLKLARVAGTADSNGDLVLAIDVPGTPGAIERYAAGGYAYVETYDWLDALTKVEITDPDNIFGAGANAVLKEYHDSEVPSSNQGWYFEKSYGAEGSLDLEPMGWYGEMRGDLKLKMTFKVQANVRVKTLIWWGKVE